MKRKSIKKVVRKLKEVKMAKEKEVKVEKEEKTEEKSENVINKTGNVNFTEA